MKYTPKLDLKWVKKIRRPSTTPSRADRSPTRESPAAFNKRVIEKRASEQKKAASPDSVSGM